jgi:hypothetical protein
MKLFSKILWVIVATTTFYDMATDFDSLTYARVALFAGVSFILGYMTREAKE